MPATLRFTCPVLIGRQEPRAFLRQRLDQASGGSGHAVVLEAEAGMGKSRLVADLADRARRQGVEVLTGRCFESEQGISFAPFTDLLHTFLHEHGLPDVSAIASDLALIAPHPSDGDHDGVSRANVDERFRHERILRALGGFIAHLGDKRPVLLVIEDLHWIDDASLATLDSLARRLESRPILLVLTVRPAEATPNVRHALAGLHRAGLAVRLELEPLAFPETMAFVRAIFGLDHRPGPAFAHALHGLTGGNPFFMEEVLGALVASGDIFRAGDVWERKALDDLAIPRSIRDAVVMRLAALDPYARQVLEIAAILGHRFEFPLLLDLAGSEERELLDALRELVDASLIVEESADELRFRHELIRQAVESGMLHRERRSIHRSAMDALAARAGPAAGDARAGEIARHAHKAEAWADALAYASVAGRHALAMGAPQASVGYFDLALDAAERLSVAPPWEVVHGRAKALDTIGDFDAALADYTRARDIGRHAGSARDEWEAALDLGFLWCSRDYAEARPYLGRALEIARASGEDALVAHSLNRIGNWLVNANEPEEGLAYHLEALTIFRRIGDRRGEAQTLDMASMAYTIGGDLVSAARLNREVIPLFRLLGDRIGEAGNHGPDMPNVFHDVVPFVGSGTIEGMREHASRAVSLAREVSWISGEAYATSILAASTFVGGNLGDGIELARRAHELASSINHQEWMVQTGWGFAVLLMDAGQFDEAVTRMDQARQLAHEIHGENWVANTAAALALARVRQGDLGGAADLLDMDRKSMRMVTQGERLRGLALAELYLAREQIDEAMAVVDRLQATAKNFSDEGDIPTLALVKAMALLQKGEAAHTLSLLDAAIATATAEGGRTTEALLRVLRLTALDALGRRDDALRERDIALGQIHHLAETLPDEARAAYLAWVLRSLPPGYREQRRAGRDGDLTRRELEVARLVATGLTNREIAERLFIAERTVESHVSAIMRKLGFQARTQIAAWTVEHDRPGT